ncbi:DUF2268 domain-containing putative Zn-dependent protease [Chloroflexota bacterium]
MSIQIYILNASGNLGYQRDLLRDSARAAIKRVRTIISLDNVDIVIKEAEDPDVYKEIDGIGGWCPSGFFIQLSIDINHPSFQQDPRRIVERTLIHELHHAARIQAGIPIGKGSFLEYMFSEGLADNFVFELTGTIPVWVPELSEEDKKRLYRIVKRKYSRKFIQRDHSLWFISGSENQRIPQFAGYALGFDFVKNYLEKNPVESAASLVTIPVDEILISI